MIKDRHVDFGMPVNCCRLAVRTKEETCSQEMSPWKAGITDSLWFHSASKAEYESSKDSTQQYQRWH